MYLDIWPDRNTIQPLFWTNDLFAAILVEPTDPMNTTNCKHLDTEFGSLEANNVKYFTQQIKYMPHSRLPIASNPIFDDDLQEE